MQFNALCRRLWLQEQRWDQRFGVQAALTYNVSATRGEGKQPSDFFPSLAPPKTGPVRPGRKPTTEEVRAGVRAMFGDLPTVRKPGPDAVGSRTS